MSYFTTEKVFIVPSFDPLKEERERLERFMLLLDRSGVGEIISKYVKYKGPKGGRPNVNYHRLFAVVLYGFATGWSTLRDLADACAHDVRFITLMEQCRPDYTTIAKFINMVIVPNEIEIFGAVTRAAAKEMGMALNDAFVDGSKFEANANKYKFVWKPTTFHERISVSFFAFCRKKGLIPEYHEEKMVSSKTVSAALTEASAKADKSVSVAVSSMLLKVLEYEEKERICGEGRKSYFKTDHGATAMCLKEDYYSGLGSNMHAAYNVQLLVCDGIVASYLVSQSRTDINDFIGVIERFRFVHGRYPANVCADAGYGSLANYKFMKDNGIRPFVKDQSWEGNASGSRPDCYSLAGDGAIVCLGGKEGKKVTMEGRHPRKAGSVFYEIKGCDGCPFHDYCFRFTKITEGVDSKIFEVAEEYMKLRAEADENLLSPKGIELRVNRSIQVEGTFGILKQDYGYERARRRGMERVSAEIMLNALGLTIAKLFRFYEKGSLPQYWHAPEGLEPQRFKKPSAKRLSKKGRRVHDKTYKTDQHM